MRVRSVILLSVVAAAPLFLPAGAVADAMVTSAETSIYAEDIRLARWFSPVEVVLAVPRMARVSEEGADLDYECVVQASNNRRFVRNVRGRYTTTLQVYDPLTTTVRSSVLDEGELVTKRAGQWALDSLIPRSSFPQELSKGSRAWVRLRVRLRGERKISTVSAKCDLRQD